MTAAPLEPPPPDDDCPETGPTDDALRAEAEEVLRRLAGEDARLRDDQWRAVTALVRDASRALVVQRTGWGKSAVYFVATALLRARGAGATVLVSPLLALMRNQVAAAQRAGIVARTLNSANVEEWDAIRTEVAAGEVDVLLVSPERLNNPDFRDTVLPRLAASAGLVVVDEAHCISDWGHDFRPDYRRIRTLLDSLPTGVPVLATTATANARVVTDVAEQLAGGDEGGAPTADGATLVLRGPLGRESLRLGVLSLPSNAHRLAWLADHLDSLPGSGIVYTLTVAQTQEVAAFLRARGHAVAAYSGQTDPEERLAAEDDLLANRVKAVVATSALGMGFDKPDLGFVVHLGAPSSPVAYYQQVGRAGRATDEAYVLLLPGEEDEAIWRHFASLGFPREEDVRETLDVLAAHEGPVSTPALEPRVPLARTRLETMLKVLDVDGAVCRVRGGWVATGEPWAYDTERYARVAETRRAEQQAMRDYLATEGCRERFLRVQLDDPHAGEACGRCDRCAEALVPDTVTDETLATAREALGRPGVTLAPKKQWPSGLSSVGVDLSGRLGADERAEPGRAVARLTDIGWGPRLRRLLAEDAPDEPLPEELFTALVEVLKGWEWERRPGAVASVPSTRRPLLVDSLRQRLASVGRLTDVGALARAGGPAPGAPRSNAAQRVRALHDAFAVTADQRRALADVGGTPVLLVDDLVDSGWTMTVAARTLRHAGAAAVLPLALATQS
jgi:ATP-dependent DNA helicase RecQ